MHIGVINFVLELSTTTVAIEAKMKGCQVRDWVVGERDMSFSRIVYMTCLNED